MKLILFNVGAITVDTITVTVKLFAAFQEAYGEPEVHWLFPVGTPVQAVLDRCLTEHPSLAELATVTRFGVNLDFVEPTTILEAGDEVVLIPPVSGG